MIHERRQAHFYASVALAYILPLGFLASLLLRPNYGPVESTAVEIFDQFGFGASPSSREENISQSMDWKVGSIPLRGEALKPTGEKPALLAITPQRAIQQPDVLVYWQAGDQPSTEALADDALFLGSLVGESRREFELTSAIRGKAGNLLIYSQGKDKVLAALPLPAEMTTPN